MTNTEREGGEQSFPLFYCRAFLNFRLMQEECAGGAVPKYHLPEDIRYAPFLKILEILEILELTFSKDLVYTLIIDNIRSHISWKES